MTYPPKDYPIDLPADQRTLLELETLVEKQCHRPDPERYHKEADTLICLLLRELGHGKIVDTFAQIKKYYG